MPASCYHLSSETYAEQKINALHNSKGNNANFPDPHMLENNVYNFHAHPWPKNTILIEGMYFNLIPLGRKKPAALVFLFIFIYLFTLFTVDIQF